MPKLPPARIHAIRASLKRETWARRLERAERHSAIVEAIDKLRSEGATEDEALAQVAPRIGTRAPTTVAGGVTKPQASRV
ncbi:MAG: hypothetical protein FJZ00_00545 [Candidatus Sericytochromatia bacterium]|uniref:Uncharacterized protein n=1 Tax=Candidatus Tanganyikabacteria bacterium TaxID=2961651 RepID=A0A937X0A7_9BACT|nr:hypothetical protein [Candidatus Tanganyikabacteria bacterium]